MNNFNYDHADMVATGMIKVSGELVPTTVDKFAAIIKTASKSIGKFPIDTKQDVTNSIYALNHNPNIPENVKHVAQCYVKLASMHHGIDYDFQLPNNLPSIVINANDIPSASVVKKFPVVKIASESFPVTSPVEIDVLKERFDSCRNDLPTIDRINIANIIKEASILNDMDIDSEAVKTYASGSLGNKVASQLALRKRMVRDSIYHDTIDKLASSQDRMTPWQFSDSLQALDTHFGFVPQKNGTDYMELFQNEFNKKTASDDDIIKLANTIDFTANDAEISLAEKFI